MTDNETLARLNPNFDPEAARTFFETVRTAMAEVGKQSIIVHQKFVESIREFQRHAEQARRAAPLWGGKNTSVGLLATARAINAIQKIPAATIPVDVNPSILTAEFPTVDVAALNCTTSPLGLLRGG